MSYDVYVNETFGDSLVGAGGMTEFIDWAEKLDLKHYLNLVQLAEHSITDNVSLLCEQIKDAIKNENPPEDVKIMLKTMLRVAKKAGDDNGEESAMWITDGSDGMVEAMLGDQAEEK